MYSTPAILILSTTDIIMAKSVQSAATTHGRVDFDDLVSGKVPPYYTTRIKNKQDVCACSNAYKEGY